MGICLSFMIPEWNGFLEFVNSTTSLQLTKEEEKEKK